MPPVLVILSLLLQLLPSSLVAAAGSKQPAAPPADHPSVPGQAFHNWRTALINTKFPRQHSTTTAANPAVTSGQQQQQQWINIVAAREQLSTIRGPPARTCPNTAACTSRLRIARTLLATAAADADADADAKTAAAAAAAAGDTQGTHSGSHRSTFQAVDSQAAAAAAAGEGRNLQQATTAPIKAGGAVSSPAAGTTSSSSSDGGGGTRGGSSSTSMMMAEGQLLAQLTVLMRQQPYKPLKTGSDDLEATLMHFVHRGPRGRLYVQGKPWMLRGMDVPDALQMAAGGPVPRSQLMYLMDRAQTLGLNTLRFRAFADGAAGVGSAVEREWEAERDSRKPGSEGMGSHIALQPAPGVLNSTMLREGLDWMVHECGLRGLRLLPVLTNGASGELGGMKQYIDWIDPALTVTDFYTNDTIKSVFLDYVAAMLSHTSSLSGLSLREDPVILGWQLAEEASHPGHPSSQVLLAWLRQFGVFMKERAPYQLLLPGVLDLFGHNSPHHLQHNPSAQVFSPASNTPHTYEARCHGVDFWLHHQPPEFDAATAGVFPDSHVACNASCKLDWARQWIRSHLRDALRMNKPLILGGIGALRPQSWRSQVLKLVRDELERGLQRDAPVGGYILSGLSHPDMPDASGWSIYYTSKGTHAARPPVANLNTQAVSDVKWRRFINYEAFLACSALQARGTSNDKGEASNTQAWVDGWEDVVHALAAMGRMPSDAES